MNSARKEAKRRPRLLSPPRLTLRATFASCSAITLGNLANSTPPGRLSNLTVPMGCPFHSPKFPHQELRPRGSSWTLELPSGNGGGGAGQNGSLSLNRPARFAPSAEPQAGLVSPIGAQKANQLGRPCFVNPAARAPRPPAPRQIVYMTFCARAGAIIRRPASVGYWKPLVGPPTPQNATMDPLAWQPTPEWIALSSLAGKDDEQKQPWKQRTAAAAVAAAGGGSQQSDEPGATCVSHPTEWC